MTYTLRLRFRVPPPRVIIISEKISQTVGGLEHSLNPEPESPGFYAVRVSGFGTEGAARAYIENIRTALGWLLLQHDVAAEAAFDIQDVSYAYDQGALLINIDGARPAVYPTGPKVRAWTGYAPLLQLGLPARAALDALTEAVQFPNFGRLAGDDRLAVALDLYRAHFTESSANARFLTLIMALEALAGAEPQTPEPEGVVNLIDQWRHALGVLRAGADHNSEEAKSLEALDTTLGRCRDGSIRRRLRRLVHETLAGDPDAAPRARRALELYDDRSELVHNGRLKNPESLGQALTDAKEIVVRILKVRFQDLVK